MVVHWTYCWVRWGAAVLLCTADLQLATNSWSPTSGRLVQAICYVCLLHSSTCTLADHWPCCCYYCCCCPVYMQVAYGTCGVLVGDEAEVVGLEWKPEPLPDTLKLPVTRSNISADCYWYQVGHPEGLCHTDPGGILPSLLPRIPHHDAVPPHCYCGHAISREG